MGREIGRYAVALAGSIFAGGRAIEAVRSWQQYRVWRERDPSGAASYLTFAQVDVAVAVTSILLAALVWWLLRPGLNSKAR